MSGTIRLAGLLTGIVLALALVGPAVFADSTNNNNSFNQDNDSQENSGILTAGAQTATQTNTTDQTSRNVARNFGNDNTARAQSNATSGAVTVWGPKLVLFKQSTPTLTTSASGNNTGGDQTQVNQANGGNASGDRTAVGGNANATQTATGGAVGATTAQNYTGANQWASADNATDRGGGNTGGNTGGASGIATGGAATGGAGGAATGGAGGAASSGAGGPAAATSTATKTLTDACNNGDANANTNASSSNTTANASGNPDCNGRVVAPADANAGSGGSADSGRGGTANAGSGGTANAGSGTSGDGGAVDASDGGANGSNVGVAKNENEAKNIGDTTAIGGVSGATRNKADFSGNIGNADVGGGQSADGGYAKNNTQFQIVGNKGGDAMNIDETHLTATMFVTAWSGDAANSGIATASIPVSNDQWSKNDADINLRLRNDIDQTLSQATSCCPPDGPLTPGPVGTGGPLAE